MAKPKRQAWKLNPSEVHCSGWSGSVSNKRLIRQSRELRNTQAHLILTHFPTGIKVEGGIPAGRYSRNRMREMKAELNEQLFSRLETLVAKALRIPGR
jgi:hypothetical protein